MQPHYPEPSPEIDLLAGKVIDAAIEVHRHLGPGYTETVYEEALCYELALRNIPFDRQWPIQLTYKGIAIGSGRLDLLIAKTLIVELKATESLLKVHSAQVLSYLRMTGCPLGLLMNFNCVLLKDGLRRIISTPSPLASRRLGVGSPGDPPAVS